MVPAAPKTIAQILRCSEDQAAAFARRVQEILGAPVSPELIAAAMQKVKTRDIASPQRVAEYLTLEMAKQAKIAATPKRTSTRARTAAAKTKAPAEGGKRTGKTAKARAKKAEGPVAVAEAPEAEAEAPPRDRAKPLEQAQARGATAQLERLLEENAIWAESQKLEVPPKHWPAEEFVREVHRIVFSDKAPRPKILKVARQLHQDDWIITPGAVAQAILDEIAAKEGE